MSQVFFCFIFYSLFKTFKTGFLLTHNTTIRFLIDCLHKYLFFSYGRKNSKAVALQVYLDYR